MRRSLILVGLLLLAAPPAPAADQIGGAYHGTVVLGPVLLDGRYPLTIGDGSPGMLDVTTSQTGALVARVTFAAQTEDAVGQIIDRKNGIRLTLRGKIDEGRIRVAATLRGSAFVGAVTMGGKKAPCRIEVGNVGPIRAKYQLTLASQANGRISGAGAVSIARQQLPVTASGSLRKGRVTLTMRAGRTKLAITNGQAVGGAITTGKWTAIGFGALSKGRRRLTLEPG